MKNEELAGATTQIGAQDSGKQNRHHYLFVFPVLNLSRQISTHSKHKTLNTDPVSRTAFPARITSQNPHTPETADLTVRENSTLVHNLQRTTGQHRHGEPPVARGRCGTGAAPHSETVEAVQCPGP